MKKIILGLLATLCLCTAAFADQTIVTYTMGTAVPITVDTTAGTYTVTGTVPTSGDYYYEYSGHRCVTTEHANIVGGVVYKSGADSIYCYPIP